MARSTPIPVIDLFAGPGGLCEGFSSIRDGSGSACFTTRISIEKDRVAHRTLLLRAAFRKFEGASAPDAYYDYVRGAIPREDLIRSPRMREALEDASQEARCAELGVDPHSEIDGWIRNALRNRGDWVLIGGPPCQAYSLAGRSRMRGRDPAKFEADKRHFLYTEYLRIIQGFAPAVFVMENVKGLLTSKHGGNPIFDRIVHDLRHPASGLTYHVRSLSTPGGNLRPEDFLVQAEDYGVPQTRHRVFLVGIRSDVAARIANLDDAALLLQREKKQVSVEQALDGLPQLRSMLSRETDSHETWLQAIREAPRSLKGWRVPLRNEIEREMAKAVERARSITSPGAPFIAGTRQFTPAMPRELKAWYVDSRLEGVAHHEARRHIRSDLHRYMFAACYGRLVNQTPKLRSFPPHLLPDHGNIGEGDQPFEDRFRVQIGGTPSTTIVSHIKKDGHYYIHPDPGQCRSFTVREAARLQTFPDNYFFEGSRTDQYGQVGNAVPPLLARKIAEVVLRVMTAAGRRRAPNGAEA